MNIYTNDKFPERNSNVVVVLYSDDFKSDPELYRAYNVSVSGFNSEFTIESSCVYIDQPVLYWKSVRFWSYQNEFDSVFFSELDKAGILK